MRASLQDARRLRRNLNGARDVLDIHGDNFEASRRALRPGHPLYSRNHRLRLVGLRVGSQVEGVRERLGQERPVLARPSLECRAQFTGRRRQVADAEQRMRLDGIRVRRLARGSGRLAVGFVARPVLLLARLALCGGLAIVPAIFLTHAIECGSAFGAEEQGGAIRLAREAVMTLLRLVVIARLARVDIAFHPVDHVEYRLRRSIISGDAEGTILYVAQTFAIPYHGGIPAS